MATQKVPEHMQFHSKYWRHFQERSQYFNIEYNHVYVIKIRAIYILTLELSLYIQCLYRPQGLVRQRFNNVVVLGLPGMICCIYRLTRGYNRTLHQKSLQLILCFFCFLYRLFCFYRFLPKSTQNAMIARWFVRSADIAFSYVFKDMFLP